MIESKSVNARYRSSVSADSAGIAKQAHRYLDAINFSGHQTGLQTTVVDSMDQSFATLKNVDAPVLPDVRMLDVLIREDVLANSNTTPLQIWEGRVISVDWDENSMETVLSAKIGNVADHVGRIDLQWVSEQDLDLVKPGAVFYLTLYKRVTKGSVQNSQELRFRRIPNWSSHQIMVIEKESERLLSKIKMGSRAE